MLHAGIAAFLPCNIEVGKHEQHKQNENSRQQVHEHSRPRKISKLVSNLITNTYIRRIALISLITSCCVILFNYGLYGEVTKAYHEDVELATFIAFFYGSIRVLAFITKMIFTSRVTIFDGRTICPVYHSCRNDGVDSHHYRSRKYITGS